MTLNAFKTLCNRIYTISFVAFVMGIPLLFSPATASVFEVHKLLFLRVMTLWIGGVALFEFLWTRSLEAPRPPIRFSRIFSYRRSDLALPFLIWLIINLVSTLFSHHLTLSIFGVYDRWEGILTIYNYAFLFFLAAHCVRSRTSLFWILGAAAGATFLSALYGILQSFGGDILSVVWSVEAAKRVFASINNPVHFSAYMGMTLPLLAGGIWYGADSFRPSWIRTVVLTLLTGVAAVIYYGMFLSYSRATWLAFCGMMALMTIVFARLFPERSSKLYFTAFLRFLATIALFYLIVVFRAFSIQWIYGLAGALVLLLLVWFELRAEASALPMVEQTPLFLKTVLFGSLIALALLQPVVFPFSNWVYGGAILVAMGAAWIWRLTTCAERYAWIAVYAQLLFVLGNGFAMGLFFLLLTGVGFIRRRPSFWLFIFPVLFGVLIMVPSLLSTYFGIGDSHWQVLKEAKEKVSSYRVIAKEGSARSSMWKSAVPWIRTYWLIGTGPDTVKYVFPRYRLPDYGRLEGGYQFTPDRLHNEFINTLATRGVFGFLMFYVGIIGGWSLFMVRAIYHTRHQAFRLILTGILSGVWVYLGQSSFNFGVVATVFFFYLLLGLGSAGVRLSDEKKETR